MSNKVTEQISFWEGDFGREYTDRNPLNSETMNQLYQQYYGKSRTELNNEFIGFLKKDAKILEVGSNVGSQLQVLKEMGFTNLYGMELQWYAVERAKSLTNNINLIQGSAFDIPFKDNYFDMVFTSGVLIHIKPDDHFNAMKEITRCSNNYIWGHEYFAEKITDINYRGNIGFLWKADFADIYLKNFNQLKLIKKELFPYLTEREKGNVDCMFLLQK